MSHLAAGRAQMGTSLAFHLTFAVLGVGLPVMRLLVPALIANDAQRQGWGRTVLGVGLAMTGVAGLVNMLSAVLVGTGALQIVGPRLTWPEAYGPFIALALCGAGAWLSLRHRQPQPPTAISAS